MPGAAAKLPAPGSLGAWLLATRPATLGIAVAPVLVGSACAHLRGSFRAGPALAALVGAVLILIGTNLANDVFDFEKGADTKERLGPTRVTQAGLLRPQAVRAGMWTAFALAALCGVYLTWVAGPVVLVIGVASILAGLAYTGGPYPLGYHGLGDVFVFAFLGLVAVGGTEFVQTGALSPLALLCAVPVGALATAVLALPAMSLKLPAATVPDPPDGASMTDTAPLRVGRLLSHSGFMTLTTKYAASRTVTD